MKITSLNGHTDGITCLCYLAPQNLIASGSWDKTIRLWNPNTGECSKTLEGHTDIVASLIVLDENTLISSSWDKTIIIWNQDFSMLKTINGHLNCISNLALLENGLLVSCSLDKSIKFWDPQRDFNCIFIINSDNCRFRFVTSIKNGIIACGAGKNVIHIWNYKLKNLKK